MPVSSVIVIGTSTGGLEALSIVIGGLPMDFLPSVVVVKHLHPSGSYLAQILQGRSAFPVSWAEHCVPLEPGRVYVAPPNFHATFSGRCVRLEEAARAPEIRFRPSINQHWFRNQLLKGRGDLRERNDEVCTG